MLSLTDALHEFQIVPSFQATMYDLKKLRLERCLLLVALFSSLTADSAILYRVSSL